MPPVTTALACLPSTSHL